MKAFHFTSMLVCTMVGLLIISPIHAQPLMPTIESLEATIVNSDHVHIARVIDFERTVDERAGSDYYLIVQVEETLKDSPFRDEPYTKLSVPVYDSESQLKCWKEKTCRVLIASESYPSRRTKVIDLSNQELQVMTAEMKILHDPDDVVATVRAAVHRLPANIKRVHTARVIVPRPIVVNTDWDSGYRTGGVAFLTVPVDQHLEKRARELLSSDDACQRAEAAKHLFYFKSEKNLQLLKPLLKDPHFHIVHENDRTVPDERFYSVRQAAFRTLREWGVNVEPPLLREPIDVDSPQR